MKKKFSAADRLTERHQDQTNVDLGVYIRENQIELSFSTPEYEGYVIFDVPWTRDRLEKYINPWVFEEMIERIFPAKTTFMGFNSRVDLEEAARIAQNSDRKKRGKSS